MPLHPNKRNAKNPAPPDSAKTPSARWVRAVSSSRGYGKRLFKRQFSLFLFLLLIFAPLTYALSNLFSPSYEAIITAIYDDKDRLTNNQEKPIPQRFTQIAENFILQFQDQAFLASLNEIKPVIQEPYWIVKAKNFRFISKLITSFSKYLDEKSLVEKETIIPSYNLRENLLFLKIRGSSEKEVTILTQQSIEIFIQKQLEKEADLAAKELSLLEQIITDITGKMPEGSLNPIEALIGVEDSKESVSHAEKERNLKREEQILDLKIQSIKRSISAEKSVYDTRRATLEAEITRLLTQVTPSHPDYIAKKEELENLTKNLQGSYLEKELLELSSRQEAIQKKIAELPLLPAKQEETSNNKTLLEKIEQDLQAAIIEVKNLQMQLRSPELRSRLRVTSPVQVTKREFINSSYALALIGAFHLLLIVALCYLKDQFDPRARDPWLIEKYCKIPVSQLISRKFAKRYARLLLSDIKKLRSRSLKKSLFQGSKQRAISTLTFLRKTSLQIYGRDTLSSLERGKIIVAIQPHVSELSSAILSSILNLSADENPHRTLVLDFNYQSNISPNPKNIYSKNILTFLQAKASWKEIRLAPDSTRAFSYAPPPTIEQAIEGSIRTIRREALRGLLEKLSKIYSCIIIHALPPDHTSLNQDIISLSDEIVLVCDGDKTSYHEIEVQLEKNQERKPISLILLT